MQKQQVKTLEQIKDSQLMFEKDVPTFGYMIIIIVFISVIGIIVWGCSANKPSVIVAQGIVTNENCNYVMPSYSGEIEEFLIQEGSVVECGQILFTIKSTDYSLQEQQLIENKTLYQEKIEKLELYVKSIKDNVNYFDESNSEDSLYYSMYERYKAQVSQNTFDGSMYSAYGYSEEQMEGEVKKNQNAIAEIYYTAINEAESAIKDAQMQIASIDVQINAIGSGQAEYEVKATTSSVIHLLNEYRKGMVVQTGVAVATITPENDDIVISSYIGTADMVRIEEGDKVQIAVDGLLQTIYGNIEGFVYSIDSNVSSINNGNETNNVFKIIIKPYSTYLVSKYGKKVNITNGMTVETRITYNEMTYVDYILEKLGLKY